MNYDYPVINDTSVVPKYYIIKQTIINWLRNGEIKAGGQLPTEKELIRHFEVSRITVRKALEELEKENYIYRVQGSGAYATDIFESEDMHSVSAMKERGFGNQIKEFGYRHERRFISIKLLPCNALDAEVLQIKESTPVLVIERVHCADGRPAIYVVSTLHPERTRGVEEFNLISKSMMGIFTRAFGREVQCLKRRVKTVLATEEMARVLETDKGFPLLQLSFQTPLESARAYYRTDIIDFIPDMDLAGD